MMRLFVRAAASRRAALPFVGLAMLAGVTLAAPPPAAAPELPTMGQPSRTFNGVTRAVWRCVQDASVREHGTVYAPKGASQGTATTDTPVGLVVLDWALDEATQSLRYTLRDKPFLVSEGQVWRGVRESIARCKR